MFLLMTLSSAFDSFIGSLTSATNYIIERYRVSTILVVGCGYREIEVEISGRDAGDAGDAHFVRDMWFRDVML